jgi:hypothetical protein
MSSIDSRPLKKKAQANNVMRVVEPEQEDHLDINPDSVNIRAEVPSLNSNYKKSPKAQKSKSPDLRERHKQRRKFNLPPNLGKPKNSMRARDLNLLIQLKD